MERDTFLSYKNFLWFWISLACVVAMTVMYVLDQPVGGKSGNSVLGYVYGGIATAGILYLMWYGIRKRAFYSKMTTLKGMLAAHVWIGIALIFIVPLHCAFHFGLNVHTLAYVLMLVTIISGIWGVTMYAKLPMYIYSQRGGGTLPQLLQQIRATSSDITKIAGMSADSKTPMRSDKFMKLLQDIDFAFKPSLRRSLLKRNPGTIDRKQMAMFLGTLPREEQEDALKLIGLVNKKRELVCQIQDEARVLTWVRLWLYFHLPVSFGCVAALAVHIFSVFYYW